MLLKSGLGFLDEEVVHAFVQVVARHVVIDDSNSVCEDGSLVFRVDIVPDLGQLALLLDDLNWLSAVFARLRGLLVGDDGRSKVLLGWPVQD